MPETPAQKLSRLAKAATNQQQEPTDLGDIGTPEQEPPPRPDMSSYVPGVETANNAAYDLGDKLGGTREEKQARGQTLHSAIETLGKGQKLVDAMHPYRIAHTPIDIYKAVTGPSKKEQEQDALKQSMQEQIDHIRYAVEQDRINQLRKQLTSGN